MNILASFNYQIVNPHRSKKISRTKETCIDHILCNQSLVLGNTTLVECAVADHLGILHTTDARFHINNTTETFWRDIRKYCYDDYHCRARFRLFSDLTNIEDKETKKIFRSIFRLIVLINTIPRERLFSTWREKEKN